MIRKAFAIFSILLLFSCAAYLRTDGFTTYQIYGPLLEGVSEPIEDEIFEMLDQPYHYLGRGRQCFVYASEDGKRVIKFFNYQRFFFPRFLECIPMPSSWRSWVQEFKRKREGRYEWTFKSISLAKKALSNETGIKFLHLQSTQNLPHLQLIGPAKRVRIIDLNQVAFFLQRKADQSIFEKLASAADLKELNEMISSIFSLLVKRIDLGIVDDDRDIGINFGFCGENPLLIDPGRLYLSDSLKTEEGFARELRASTKKLYRWLLENRPDGALFLDQKIKSNLNERQSLGSAQGQLS